MFKLNFAGLAAVAALSTAAYAQDATPDPAQPDPAAAIDCTIPANASNPACLGLPADGTPITNFAPIVGPIAAAGALAGLAGGGGSDGTTSTTSTTSTTN